MNLGEVGLERGVAELVDSTSLPQYLAVECVLKESCEMYATLAPLGEDELGQVYQGNLPSSQPGHEPGYEASHESPSQAKHHPAGRGEGLGWLVETT